MEILNVENLNFTYAAGTEPVLSEVSFKASAGDFVTVCGATGSGKSTLLRLLKREIAPNGKLSGTITLFGQKQMELTETEATANIGFVMQKPEHQIVCDKVWHELAFGLENLGVPKEVIRRKVAETASYFGIDKWFLKDTAELSGGQKQLLNLAAIMVMEPKLLLLDEPTAMLDPIAATEFIQTVARLNRETGVTVIIIEHNLQEVLWHSNKVLALEKGRIICYADMKTAVETLSTHPQMKLSLPMATRLYAEVEENGTCQSLPISVTEGRNYVENNFRDDIKSLNIEGKDHEKAVAPVLSFEHVYFRYRKELPDVLKDFELTVFDKEIFCLLGGNGSGKSTALNVAAGLNKAYAGNIKVLGKKLKDYKNQELRKNTLSYLPQDVQTVFLCNTVREELKGINLTDFPYDFSKLLDRHPYDLSGGEQQLVAMAIVLNNNPRVLLMDEPTKGLDSFAKERLKAVLFSLREKGVTQFIVTHDVEFAAECSDRCALLFNGEITSIDKTAHFFSENNFYTTAISRMTRGKYREICTLQGAVDILKINGRLNDGRI